MIELIDRLGFWACYSADETYHKDMWSVFAAAAGRTSRLRMGPEVTHVIIKDPTIIAPSYQAHVWSARENKRIRKTFPTLTAVRAWRSEAVVDLRRGTLRAPTSTTLRQAWEAWFAGARGGSVRNRSGDLYKPSALRGYESSMRLRVLPELGGARLSDITRVTVQDLADRMLANGLGRARSATRSCRSGRSFAVRLLAAMSR